MLSVHTSAYRATIEQLVKARKAANLTQEQVARAWGSERSVISKIETCERRIDLAEFVALAIVVKLDPVEVIRELHRQLSHIHSPA